MGSNSRLLEKNPDLDTPDLEDRFKTFGFEAGHDGTLKRKKSVSCQKASNSEKTPPSNDGMSILANCTKEDMDEGENRESVVRTNEKILEINKGDEMDENCNPAVSQISESDKQNTESEKTNNNESSEEVGPTGAGSASIVSENTSASKAKASINDSQTSLESLDQTKTSKDKHAELAASSQQYMNKNRIRENDGITSEKMQEQNNSKLIDETSNPTATQNAEPEEKKIEGEKGNNDENSKEVNQTQVDPEETVIENKSDLKTKSVHFSETNIDTKQAIDEDDDNDNKDESGKRMKHLDSQKLRKGQGIGKKIKAYGSSAKEKCGKGKLFLMTKGAMAFSSIASKFSSKSGEFVTSPRSTVSAGSSDTGVARDEVSIEEAEGSDTLGRKVKFKLSKDNRRTSLDPPVTNEGRFQVHPLEVVNGGKINSEANEEEFNVTTEENKPNISLDTNLRTASYTKALEQGIAIAPSEKTISNEGDNKSNEGAEAPNDDEKIKNNGPSKGNDQIKTIADEDTLISETVVQENKTDDLPKILIRM